MVAKARANTVAPKVGALVDRIQAKQVGQRQEITAMVAHARSHTVAPKVVALVDRIQAKQARSRAMLVEQLANRHNATNAVNGEIDG